jgi:hypothetical protein
MPAKRYKVKLSEEERQKLEQITKNGKSAAAKINHAHILLKADENQEEGGWKDQSISDIFNISLRTIERVRQRFVEEGLENALSKANIETEKTRRRNRSPFDCRSLQ